LVLACAVAEKAYEQNLAQQPVPDKISKSDLKKSIAKLMYDPRY